MSIKIWRNNTFLILYVFIHKAYKLSIIEFKDYSHKRGHVTISPYFNRYFLLRPMQMALTMHMFDKKT